MTDGRGTPIVPGQRVAYNLSGTVCLGEVVSVTPGIPDPSGWGYKKRPVIEVRPLIKMPDTSKYHNKPSKIGSPHNLLVLLDDEN